MSASFSRTWTTALALTLVLVACGGDEAQPGLPAIEPHRPGPCPYEAGIAGMNEGEWRIRPGTTCFERIDD